MGKYTVSTIEKLILYFIFTITCVSCTFGPFCKKADDEFFKSSIGVYYLYKFNSDTIFVKKHHLENTLLVLNADSTYYFVNDSAFLNKYSGNWTVTDEGKEFGDFVFTYKDGSIHRQSRLIFAIDDNQTYHVISFTRVQPNTIPKEVHYPQGEKAKVVDTSYSPNTIRVR